MQDVAKDDGWFECFDDVRNVDEERFLEKLRQNAAKWELLGVKPNDTQASRTDRNELMVHCDLSDATGQRILQTLRLDFSSAGIRAFWAQGEAFGWQTPRPGAPGGIWIDGPLIPNEAADIAANWFERQIRRPVDLLEWLKDGRVVHSVRSLADTGECITFDENVDQPTPPERPPDRRTRLRN